MELLDVVAEKGGPEEGPGGVPGRGIKGDGRSRPEPAGMAEAVEKIPQNKEAAHGMAV